MNLLEFDLQLTELNCDVQLTILGWLVTELLTSLNSKLEIYCQLTGKPKMLLNLLNNRYLT